MIATKSTIYLTGSGCKDWDVEGGFFCCSSTNKCGIGEGDCDTDDDCFRGLTCGVDNCDTKNGFDEKADCCTVETGTFM